MLVHVRSSIDLNVNSTRYVPSKLPNRSRTNYRSDYQVHCHGYSFFYLEYEPIEWITHFPFRISDLLYMLAWTKVENNYQNVDLTVKQMIKNKLGPWRMIVVWSTIITTTLRKPCLAYQRWFYEGSWWFDLTYLRSTFTLLIVQISLYLRWCTPINRLRT